MNPEDKNVGIEGERYVDEEKDELKQEVEAIQKQVKEKV